MMWSRGTGAADIAGWTVGAENRRIGREGPRHAGQGGHGLEARRAASAGRGL